MNKKNKVGKRQNILRHFFGVMEIIALIIFCIIPASTFAAGESSYTANTQVTVNGISMTILAGSTAQSVTYGLNTMTVVAGSGNSLTIEATDAHNILNNDGGLPSCSSPYPELAITSGTVVITPGTTGCNPNGSQTYYNLSLSKSGSGTGTVTGTGLSFAGTPVNCGSSCGGSFSYGQTVTLTAVPAEGSIFASWTGDCLTATGLTCAFVINGVKNIGVIFNQAGATSLSGNNSGFGSTTPLSFSINGGATTTTNSVVSLSFNADPNIVKAYAVSLDPNFVNATITPYTASTTASTFTIPAVTGSVATIYVKYYSITGAASSVISQNISYNGITAVVVPVFPIAPVKPPAGYVFTRKLKLGSHGADVKALQQFLNTNGFVLAKSGAGSPGNETMVFGPVTVKALIKFQEANIESILKPFQLTKGTGVFGSETLKVVNGLE